MLSSWWTYCLSVIFILLLGVGFELRVGLLVERVLNLFSMKKKIVVILRLTSCNPYRWRSSRFFCCSSRRENRSISVCRARCTSSSFSVRRVSSSCLEANTPLSRSECVTDLLLWWASRKNLLRVIKGKNWSIRLTLKYSEFTREFD